MSKFKPKKLVQTTTYTIYNDYLKNKIGPLTKEQFFLISEVFRRIGIKLIRDVLLLRMPYGLGNYGIVKKSASKRPKRNHQFSANSNLFSKPFLNKHTNGYFFRYLWMQTKPFLGTNAEECYLGMYTFRPWSDKGRREIGQRGLSAWIQKCANDPTIKDYDAPDKLPKI